MQWLVYTTEFIQLGLNPCLRCLGVAPNAFVVNIAGGTDIYDWQLDSYLL